MLFLVAKLPEEKIIRKSTRAISSLKYYKFQILHPSKKKIQILGSVLFILLQMKKKKRKKEKSINCHWNWDLLLQFLNLRKQLSLLHFIFIIYLFWQELIMIKNLLLSTKMHYIKLTYCCYMLHKNGWTILSSTTCHLALFWLLWIMCN
jgi:hypothetical protein